MPNLALRFFDSVDRRPDAPALVLDGTTLSYRELEASVNRLTRVLGGANEPFVGLLAQKSETAYAGLLAILTAGSAYVPLNPGFPTARNVYIAEKVGLRTFVVGPECVDTLREVLAATTGDYRIVTLANDPEIAKVVEEFPSRLSWIHTDRGAGAPRTVASVPDDHPAYVLFTSGSTGNPKGVLVRQDNVASYAKSVLALYPIFETDRVSQTFDLTFDLSVHDVFACFTVGATLVPFPADALTDPIPFTRESAVSVWFSVPSLVARLEAARLVESGALPNLRLSLFCGEKLTTNAVAIFRAVAPSTRIVNLYGPTEATIAITHFELEPDLDALDALHGVIPLGRPFEGQRCEIRTEDGSVAADGEIGGLYLAGDQITSGYFGEPALTRDRFVPDVGGTVWYRTGDLALRDAKGVLKFVGREDFQVKVMGYRIELGEIEHALVEASGASHAVADVAAIRNGIDEIYAVLPSSSRARKKAIKLDLRERLPSYMLPRHYFFEDEFPLNANGKIDRGELRRRALERSKAELD